jgi:hypothetical protein
VARLEELTKGAVICGVFGDRRLLIVDVAWHGSTAITLTYTDERRIIELERKRLRFEEAEKSVD